MVLDRSDYKIPAPGQTWDPTDGLGFATKAVGAVVATTVAAYAVFFAIRRGVPFLDSVLGTVGLSTQAGGSSGGIVIDTAGD